MSAERNRSRSCTHDGKGMKRPPGHHIPAALPFFSAAFASFSATQRLRAASLSCQPPLQANSGTFGYFFSVSSMTEPMTSTHPIQPIMEKSSSHSIQQRRVLTTGSRLPMMAACTGERCRRDCPYQK